MFDVFLSHASSDTSAVAQLAEMLRAQGLRPWLDVEQCVPGRPFVDQLAEGLRSSRCCAVFVGADDISDWVREELRAAMGQAAGARAFRVFLVLLPTAPQRFDWTALDPFLSTRTWVDLRVTDGEAVDLLARAVRGEPLGWTNRDPDAHRRPCPYVGLRSFTEDDSDWFFGRDGDVQRVIEKLRHTPFLAVLGRSGSGKSSVVRAGVLPALASGGALAGGSHWRVQIMRPTSSPLQQLAAHLNALRPDLSAVQILDDLHRSDLTLKLLTSAHDGASPILWVIDQAEELFTLCDDTAAREAFTANLLHACHLHGPARIILTLRADFYPRFAELPALSDRIAAHQYVVTGMSRGQLADIIERPALAAGLRLEDGLSERLLDEVTGQPGGLPLVQHALLELCEQREGRALTHRTYARINGVRGALARRAEVTMERFDPADREIARILLLSMLRLGEGEGDTRQPVRLSQLAAPLLPLDRLQNVAATLADARLVTTDRRDDDVQVDFAHEALIRNWPRLQAWLREGRDDLRMRRRLQQASLAWREGDRSDDLLYRGTALSIASEWLDGREDQVPTAIAEFVAASSRREADLRSSSSRRRRRIFVVMVMLTIVAVVAATIAVFSAAAAQREARRADDTATRALTSQATVLMASDPALALAAASEAHARGRNYATQATLHAVYAMFSNHRGFSVATLDRAARQVTFSPDGETLAITDDDGVVTLVDPASGRPRHRLRGAGLMTAFSQDSSLLAMIAPNGDLLLLDPVSGARRHRLEGAGSDVVFSPDSSLVAAIGGDGDARVWRTDDGTEVAALRTPASSVAFSADGELMAIADGDGDVLVVDPVSGARRHRLEGAGSDVVFSPDGTQLATIRRDGEVRVWRADDGVEIIAVRRGGPEVAFSADGALMAIAGGDGDVLVVDPVSGARRHRLEGAGSDVVFSPDSSLVAAIGGDGDARVWRTDDGTEVAALRTPASSAAFRPPDGALLATASSDGNVTLWQTGTSRAVTVLRAAGSDVVFSPDGQRLVTVDDDRNARLWDPNRGEPLTQLPIAGRDVKFSADGTMLAVSDPDDTVRVIDLKTQETVAALERAGLAVAVSPDGALVAASGPDGTTVWDVDREQLLHRLPITVSLAFSPDGTTLAASGTERSPAWLWDVAERDDITTLPVNGEDIAYAPDGMALAVADLDETVHFVDPATRETTDVLPEAGVVVAFSPDGVVLAAASPGGTVTLWDVASARRLRILTGGGTPLAFSPDGALLAAVTADDALRLWNPRSGELLATVDDVGSRIAFSPDGTLMATADDTAVTLWPRISDSGAACGIARRYVTETQLNEALGEHGLLACADR